MTKSLLAAGLAITLAVSAQAAPIGLPSTFFVDAQSPGGYTLVLSGLSSSDTLSFTVFGTPTLQYPELYGVNAAGVVTIAGSSPVGDTSTDPYTGLSFGSLGLELGGGPTKQLFATSTTNGLGSAAPPTTLTFSESLADIFGLMPNTTLGTSSLTFLVDDYLFTDNTGGFTITATTAAVPEPESWALMLAGIALLGGVRRKHRSLKAA